MKARNGNGSNLAQDFVGWVWSGVGACEIRITESPNLQSISESQNLRIPNPPNLRISKSPNPPGSRRKRPDSAASFMARLRDEQNCVRLSPRNSKHREAEPT